MSFLDWFFSKSRESKSAGGKPPHGDPVAHAHQRLAHPLPQRLVLETPQSTDDQKIRRHARREELYQAIRDSMTRSGVLSTRYKFKVLSLDSRGNEFLVMIDLSAEFGDFTGRLNEMEALVMRDAKARFEITVPSVYWRIDAARAVSEPKPEVHEEGKPAVQNVRPVASTSRPGTPAKPAASPSEAIEADEVAPLMQALLAVSKKAPATVVKKGDKSPGGLRSYSRRTDFEDTELFDPTAKPDLSKTQYGDLR